jgi:putative transposase
MDTRKQRRNSLRLQGYDYSDPGDYFVTVCTYQRALWLCDIEQARVVMTPWGKIVQRCWHTLPRHYDYVHLGAFTLMPNH